MQKVILSLILLLVLNGSVCFAQEPILFKNLDSKMRNSYPLILKADSEGIVALKTTTKGTAIGMFAADVKAEISIDQFDSELNLTKSTLVEGFFYELYNKVDNSIEFITFTTSGKLVLGHSSFEGEVSRLMLSELDINSGKISNTKLLHQDNVLDRRGTYQLIKSADNKNIGLCSYIGKDKKNLETLLFYAMLDSELNMSWSNVITLPFYSKISSSSLQNLVKGADQSSIYEGLLLNNGRFLFNFTVQEEDYKKSERNEFYNFLVSVGEGNFSLFTHKIGSDKKEYIKNLLFIEDEDGKGLLVGNYGTNNNKTFTGRYFAKIGIENLAIEKELFIPYSPQEKKQLLLSSVKLYEDNPEKAQKDAEKLDEVSFFKTKSLTTNLKGDLILWSEFEFVRTIIERSQTSSTSRIEARGGDIYKQQLDSNGNIISTILVPRTTYSPEIGSNSSFQLRTDNETDYIFYPDESKGRFIMGKINPFGQVTKTILFDKKEDDRFRGFWLVCYSPHLTDGKYLYTFIRNKFNFALVRFDISI